MIVDPTLDPDQDRRVGHAPGYLEKRRIVDDITAHRAFDNWGTNYTHKDDLVVATLTTKLGTYTLTDLRGSRSLFLQRTEDIVQLDELLENPGIGSVLNELCESIRTVSLAERRLFESLPRVAQAPAGLASVPGTNSWLVTFGAAGIYLDYHSGDGAIQVHCDKPKEEPHNFQLKIQVSPSLFTWRDHTAELAWRDHTGHAKDFPAIRQALADLVTRTSSQFSRDPD